MRLQAIPWAQHDRPFPPLDPLLTQAFLRRELDFAQGNPWSGRLVPNDTPVLNGVRARGRDLRAEEVPRGVCRKVCPQELPLDVRRASGQEARG